MTIARSAGLRWVRLLIGLLLYGTSLALIVRAHLGVGPWDVLSQGVARASALGFGLVTDLIGAAVLLLWWPLRQRFGFGTIANVLLVGTAAGAVLLVLPTTDLLAIRIPLFACGLVLLAVATGIYVGAGLGAGPRDGLMLGLHARFGIPLWVGRLAVEGTVLVAGWLLGGDVGIGTIAFAVLVGPLCAITVPRLAAGVVHRPPRPSWEPRVHAPAAR